MAKDTSMRAFKCPSCGAPLEPEIGTLTMKCPYCGGTVIIPESLRTRTRAAGPTMGEVFDFGLNGLDMNKIVGNAMNLPKAISLAQQGRIDEAADIYSQITGMQHADAVAAVKTMAAGHAVSLTPGDPATSWQRSGSSYQQSSVQVSTPASFSTGPTTKSSGGGRSCGLLIGIIVIVAVLILVLVGGGLAFLTNFTSGSTVLPAVPAGFASRQLSFGSEGISQGMFEDPRSVGVDGDGNITVSDYSDGRIQTFDPNGKFVNGFSVSPDGKDVYVTGMAVSRKGEIYVVHNQEIYIFDSSGNPVGEISDDTHDYEDVAVGADGKLYAIANNETIVRFNADRTVDLEVPDTFTNAADHMEIDAHVAADGLGNMYIVGAFNYVVLKYSPQGKFLNRFGGHATGAASNEPSKFTSPRDISIDGQGRVFVCDFFDIKVFDSDGAYLNIVRIDGGGPFGITIDNENNLFTITTNKKVEKYVLKPAAE